MADIKVYSEKWWEKTLEGWIEVLCIVPWVLFCR